MSSRILLAFVLGASLVGCAAPARIEQMTTTSSMATRAKAESSALRQSVGVKEVTGGKETNPMWISNVGSSEFEQALEASLKDVGLLAPIKPAAKYHLIANLEKLEQPMIGFSMTVTSSVRYMLVDVASKKTVYEKSVVVPYTASVSDAFVGTERLRLANEGSIKANIQQIIDDMIAFRADGVTVKVQN